MVIIRRAMKKDLQLLPIGEFLRETSFAGGSKATALNAQIFMNYATKAIGGPFMVAEEDGRIIGFTLGIASGDPIETGFRDLIGFGTWVDPEWRTSGYGRAMRSMFEEAASEDGFTRILELVPMENINTMRIIERNGYRAIQTVYERKL